MICRSHRQQYLWNSLVIAGALVLPHGAASALDLTPAPDFRELEGFKIPIVRFVDGAATVVYQPPAGWKINGGGNLLSLCPIDRSDVTMEMRVVALKNGQPGGSADIEQWCAEFLPKDAALTAATITAISPFTLRGLSSRELTFAYVSQGIRFSKAVAFVDLAPAERLVVIVTARTRDFPAAHEEALRSLFTINWQG